MKLAIVILNYNCADLTIQFYQEMKDYENIDEFVIVDNNSTDNSVEKFRLVQKNNHTHIIYNKYNGGYGYGNNIGIEYAYKKLRVTHVIVANPDIHISKKCIGKMQEVFEIYPKSAVVSAVQRIPRGDKVISCWNLYTKLEHILKGLVLCSKIIDFVNVSRLRKVQNYIYADCVSGSMLMIDCEKFFQAGGYDENVFLYMEEEIIGKRIKELGYYTIVILDSFYIHEHGMTINKKHDFISQRELLWKSREYYFRKYLRFNKLELKVSKSLFTIGTYELLFIKRMKQNITWNRMDDLDV